MDKHDGVDFVGDVSDLSRFSDESVDEIFASNILEHFPHQQTVGVLREWHRALVPGGKLMLSVPNFARAVEIYQARGLKDWVENFLMGDQVYKSAFHYALFDEARLGEKVMKAGFKDFRLVTHFPMAPQKDCSNLVSSHDGEFVCINAEAIK